MSAPRPHASLLADASATVETWCAALIETTSLDEKLVPPPAPARFADPLPAPRRIASPGRPPELRVVARAPKSPRAGALRDPRRVVELLHAFLHHELQAAELMAWAVLAFPAAPEAFRRGLVRIAEDELRHVGLFRAEIERLGGRVGSLPVRDWFWERVPTARSPAAFVALLGIGLEGGNLDHATRWARLLREAGQPESAAIVERIGEEEVPHVRFAVRWLAHFEGDSEWASWLRALPPPLTPLLFRGQAVDRDRRRKAGLSADFVDRLAAWTDDGLPT